MLNACNGTNSFSGTLGGRVRVVIGLDEEGIAASVARLRVLWKLHDVCVKSVLVFSGIDKYEAKGKAFRMWRIIKE